MTPSDEPERFEAKLLDTAIATGSLFINVDFNELLSTRSEEETFELLGKLKDLLA
jgi:hypothetical protein